MLVVGAAAQGSFELPEVHMSRWRCGRVMLIGDSAHAMCNRLGSGGCTGMEDAAVLAENISLCLRAGVGAEQERSRGDAVSPVTSDEAIARRHAIAYAFCLTERRRMKRARRIQFESRMLAQVTVCYASSTVFRAMRDSALRWIGRRTERWRLPVFDFLNNYRASVGHSLIT